MYICIGWTVIGPTFILINFAPGVFAGFVTSRSGSRMVPGGRGDKKLEVVESIFGSGDEIGAVVGFPRG